MSVPPDRDRISRREFVRGRFWPKQHSDNLSADASAGLASRAQRDSLVMRYPKTLGDVEASDDASLEQAGGGPLAPAVERRRTIPIMRPPGAVHEPEFLERCTRCEDCAKGCPHDAIIRAPDRMREAAGTPMIEADHQACLMCEDFPCIAACDTGALTSLVPPMMGTAVVTHHLCLAHHGTTCSVCVDRCPVEAAVLVSDGKPTVDESVCTGCGVCRYVCPAPENAILLMPAFLRPSPPRSRDRE